MTAVRSTSAAAVTSKKLTNLLGISQCTPVSTATVVEDSDNFLCTAGASRIREVLSPTAQPRSAMPALSDVKIPPPELCHSNSTNDSLLSVDSSKNSVFFPSESSPNRSYISRIGGDTKDIRRRVSHNEVERRRRDRINTWIAELHKLLPPEHQAKSQYQSKGVILKRVFEYFQNVAQILSSKSTTIEKLSEKNQALEQELRQLNRENQLLRASLNAHFSDFPTSSALSLSVLTPATAGSSARFSVAPTTFSKVIVQQEALHNRICSGDLREDSVLNGTVCTRQSPKRLASGNGGSGVSAAVPSSTPFEQLPAMSPSTDSSPPYKRALLFPLPPTTSATASNPALSYSSSTTTTTDVSRPCM
uniref:Upstream stimulatory factor 1 n=1 Tax=Schistocephalus solidus TaxID=70667 RepID=A0A0X3NR99_SCHSO